MGTVFSFDIRPPGVTTAALGEAEALLYAIDATFSTYRKDSQISRLARGELRIAECSPDVRTVLDECERYRRLTGRYFSAYAGGSLDPSGYVKGWAIERVSNLLREAGSASHCLNGGGDVQCVGAASSGTPWRIGVSDPRAGQTVAAVVAGTDFAVATSGVEQRGAHILDPHTGRPSDGLLSLTIIGRHLTEADAFATAAFAMGHRARDWVAGLAGYRAFAVTVQGETWSTSGNGSA
jgi:thiamine biosynthesis lipoprotein